MASKKQKLEDMPLHLRGFSNNRWGGHKSNRIRGFKGSTYGAASVLRHIPITTELRLQMETVTHPSEPNSKQMDIYQFVHVFLAR